MGSYQNGDAEPKKMIKARKKTASAMEMDDIITLMHGSDPVRLELTRLENEVREKDRELGEANAEIKALKLSERLKEKAVEELSEELARLNDKIKTMESLLESKTLEIKKINEEKKAAMVAQFAAEATLRKVHAAQKDDEMPPIEAILAPLEAELKLAKTEVAKLQEDNKALERLTKSKELALLEAERTVEIALAKASLVDDLQNKNQELSKQIEICQEENKIMDKMHKQKVSEVEKLTQTVRELEEAVLSGGAAANAVRDFQRQVQELNEEKRILDRELARAKVSANRVAVVVANDWKDASDKVMPVKQWLDERKFYQGEMQQLKSKLAVAERAAKSEAQLKEKYMLRFKVLEEQFKGTSQGRSTTIARTSLGGFENLPRPGQITRNGTLSRQERSKFTKGDRKLSNGDRILHAADHASNGVVHSPCENGDLRTRIEKMNDENEDYVSGTLYDTLQKEVIALRKACQEKTQSLKDKEDTIEMLSKKVDTLTKARESESRKMRRDFATMEKEVAAIRSCKPQDQKSGRLPAASASITSSSRSLSMRYGRYP